MTADAWDIDTSTGTAILVFNRCSVIEDEMAHYVLGLIRRDQAMGRRVRKTKGSSWQGRIVGYYTTTLTPIGYCVESEREPGSVQIYPESALERVEG